MISGDQAVTIDQSERMTPGAKNAVKGAWIGQFVDFYDIYVPIIALAPAIIYFAPSSLSTVAQSTFALTVFAVSFLGRPIGTFIFGHISDRIGRKKATLFSAAGITVAMFLTVFLPGYATAGVWALVLLVILRLVGGVFMGGMYTGANPLAIESSPKRLRGLIGGVIGGAYPLAYVAVSVFTTLILTQLPAADANDPYMVWGWRIPFFIGAVLSLLFFFYYYKRVEESEVWREAVAGEPEQERRSPLLELFSGDNLKTFIQVFVMMTGIWFGLQVVAAVTPTLLIGNLEQSGQTVTNGLLVGNLVLAASYIVYGVLGQRLGRRRIYILSGLWTTTLTASAYFYMAYNLVNGGSLVLSLVLVVVCMVLTLGPNAMTIAYLCERFPTGVRSSGYGIGYSLAIVIPSFYQYMMLGLGSFMPYVYTPVVLIVIGGVLMAIGAALGPNTNEVDV